MTGSPAHAGIDPAGSNPTGRPWRFPRTRGERPVAAVLGLGDGEVPPHTRG